MKKLFLLLFGLLLALPAFPRSFQYEYEGQTITYSVIDEDAGTVRTTEGSYDGFGNPIAGSQVYGTLILPANPKDGEKTYTLTTISNRSFSNCSLLYYVSIPYSVTSIRLDAFDGCYSLNEIYVDPDNPVYYSYDGMLFDHNSWLLLCPNARISCRIPSFAYLACAFNNCYHLEYIDVDPDNPYFSSYDGILFNKDFSQLLCCPCGRMTSIDLHDFPIISIAEHAFHGCSCLTSIEIPNSVTTIGAFAFYESSLTTVDIPDSVTHIGEGAFCSCCNLKSINIDSLNPKYCSSNGILFSKDLSNIRQYPAGKKGDYEIPDYVTTIGTFAFSGCDSLTSLTIPNSVKIIGTSAFEKCNLLTAVEIPASVSRFSN